MPISATYASGYNYWLILNCYSFHGERIVNEISSLFNLNFLKTYTSFNFHKFLSLCTR